MKTIVLGLVGLIALLLSFELAARESAAEPVYVYQRIHVLVAHHDNRVSLRVWPDGRVEMRFPPYTPQAGFYQWTATPTERAELDAFFTQAERHDASVLASALSARGDQDLVLVADADVVRFEWRGADRASNSLLIESPEAWSRALPESSELSDLAQIESGLLDWMRVQAARRSP